MPNDEYIDKVVACAVAIHPVRYECTEPKAEKKEDSDEKPV